MIAFGYVFLLFNFALFFMDIITLPTNDLLRSKIVFSASLKSIICVLAMF